MALLLWLFGLLRFTAVLQVIYGIQISWTYLRFFKVTIMLPSIGNDETQQTVVEIRYLNFLYNNCTFLEVIIANISNGQGKNLK